MIPRAMFLAGALAAVFVILAEPCRAHLLVRGRTLSELTLGSGGAAVAKVVQLGTKDGVRIEVHVKRTLYGKVPAGRVSVAVEGHHPPIYDPGETIVLFVEEAGGNWVSRQTELEKIVIEEPSLEPVTEAIGAYAELRGLPPDELRRRLRETSVAQIGSGDPRVQRDAVYDLQRFAARDGGASSVEIARLAGLVARDNGDPAARLGIVSLFTLSSSVDTVPILTELVERVTTPRVKIGIVQALAARRDPRAVDPLLRLVEAKNLALRLAAVAALGEIADPRALANLDAIAQASPDEPLSLTARDAVAKIRSAAEKKDGAPAAGGYGVALPQRSSPSAVKPSSKGSVAP